MYEIRERQSVWLVNPVCLESANTALDTGTKTSAPAWCIRLYCLCNQMTIEAFQPKGRHFKVGMFEFESIIFFFSSFFLFYLSPLFSDISDSVPFPLLYCS